MKPKCRKSQVLPWLITIFSCVVMIGATFIYTTYAKAKMLYQGEYLGVRQQALEEAEKSNGKSLVSLFYSEEEINQLLNPNLDYIIPSEVQEENGIEIHKLKGTTYQAFMMVVKDPSKVSVACNPHMDSGAPGYTLEKYIEQEGAIAGINAGGFEDVGGNGNGGQAWGIVIQDGKLISGRMDEYTTVIGMNSKHSLVVGDMTPKQALEWDIQEAVTFGPIFIDKFKVVFEKGRHPGLNPRTVIGQRDDGAMLLLVIDGRQPLSFGSTYQDIIDIMLQFNAMTAANLDGGNSTVMIYDGEVVNSLAGIYGDRRLPTAFVVKGE